MKFSNCKQCGRRTVNNPQETKSSVIHIGTTMSNLGKFHYAMQRYYHIERDRSEECLGDIITILSSNGEYRTSDEVVDVIIDRIIQHYER